MKVYKSYASSLKQEQIEWLKKEAKSHKVNQSVYLRSLIDFLQQYKGDELKKEITRTRIESELAEAEEKAQQYVKQVDRLKEELEGVSA